MEQPTKRNVVKKCLIFVDDRQSDLQILSAGQLKFTSDPRIQILHETRYNSYKIGSVFLKLGSGSGSPKNPDLKSRTDLGLNQNLSSVNCDFYSH